MLDGIDFMEQKEGYEDTLKTVNDDDLNGASLAFVRLQKTYHLETSALSKGEIDGVKYRCSPLTVNFLSIH